MAKYFLTNKAVEDLSKIYEYTYEFWSENQADKYYEELINFCQLLAENQMIGRIYTEIYPDLYGFLANQHIIFYRIYFQYSRISFKANFITNFKIIFHCINLV